MNIPKDTISRNKSFTSDSDVYLEAAHICIKKNIAEKVFNSESVVLSVFYNKDHTFMVAPASEELFRTIHKANQQMLKNKNIAGDKSISIQELLLDNDVNENDRNLEFIVEEALHILKVKL